MKISIEKAIDILITKRIILVGGEFGRGKTLFIAAYCFLSFLYKNRTEFFSNMPLNFGNMQKFVNVKPLISTSQFSINAKNTTFVLDEIQEDLDSRNFMSEKNKFLSNWSRDLRKDGSQVLGSVQYMDFIEKRLSQLMQCLVIPTFINNYHNDEDIEKQIRLENKDFLSLWTIKDIKNGKEYFCEINMYPFIKMYITGFKPQSLISNHKEYLDYKELTWSQKKFEKYVEDCNKYILEHNEYWNNEYKENFK